MKVRDLKKGDVFLEEDMGMCIVCRANEDARLVFEEFKEGYECSATVLRGDRPAGDVIEYFEAHNAGAYGPKLYRTTAPAPGQEGGK